MIYSIIHFLNWFILWYFILLSLGYLILLLSSIPDINRRFNENEVGKISDSFTKSYSLPPVTVIIPVFNGGDHIVETIYSILKNAYPNIFIIVVNDGSTDHTLNILMSTFNLSSADPLFAPIIKTQKKINKYYISCDHNNLTVIDTDHTDKADSMNLALNACRTPFFITIDADSILEPTAISRIIFYMLTHHQAVAVGGALYILNGCTHKNGEILKARMSSKLLFSLQACEYLRSFLFSRAGWNKLGGALCYAGAFTLFNYKTVIDLNGFEVGNPSEDFEIITRLQENRYRKKLPDVLRYTPAAVSWTSVPGTIKDLWHQRSNWQFGSLKSLMRWKKMLFNPRYGIVGLFTYPFYLFGETLGAVVELTGYLLILVSYLLGVLNIPMAILFFLVAYGFITLITMATALINFVTYDKYRKIQDLLWIMIIVIIESFGFRQFLVLCRVVATFRYVFTKKSI